MTRSLDQARSASDRLQASMQRAKASDKLVTQEQMQAAGFAEQPKTDPNAGLPRYEDVAAAWVDNRIEPRAMPALDTGQQSQQPPAQPPMDYPVPEQIQYAQPEPPTELGAMVGMLIQQMNQLMRENATLREQLMQMMNRQSQGGIVQDQPVHRPRNGGDVRAANLSDEERWRMMTSGGGLIG